MVHQQRFWAGSGRYQDMVLWRFLTEFFLRKPELGSLRSKEQHRIQAGHFHRWWLAQRLPAGEYSGPPRVRDLTRGNVSAAMDWVREFRGVAASTANKLALHLHAVANYAAILDEDRPIARWNRYPVVRKDPTAWSLDQFRRIVDAARHLRGELPDGTPQSRFCEAWLLAAYNAGDRSESIWQMRWEWIDWKDRYLRIPGSLRKDNEDLTVALLEETAAALLALSRYRRDLGPRVWAAWPYDSAGPPRKAWNLQLRKLVYVGIYDATARVEDLTARDVRVVSGRMLTQMIRRTFATEAAANSDIATASRLCGHSRPETTMRSYIDPTKMPAKNQRDVLRPVETGPRLWLPDTG